MNEKGEIRTKEEKSRLPADVRGSKTSVLKLSKYCIKHARQCFIGIPNTEERVENKMHIGVLLTKFEVFG